MYTTGPFSSMYGSGGAGPSSASYTSGAGPSSASYTSGAGPSSASYTSGVGPSTMQDKSKNIAYLAMHGSLPANPREKVKNMDKFAGKVYVLTISDTGQKAEGLIISFLLTLVLALGSNFLKELTQFMGRKGQNIVQILDFIETDLFRKLYKYHKYIRFFILFYIEHMKVIYDVDDASLYKVYNGIVNIDVYTKKYLPLNYSLASSELADGKTESFGTYYISNGIKGYSEIYDKIIKNTSIEKDITINSPEIEFSNPLFRNFFSNLRNESIYTTAFSFIRKYDNTNTINPFNVPYVKNFNDTHFYTGIYSNFPIKGSDINYNSVFIKEQNSEMIHKIPEIEFNSFDRSRITTLDEYLDIIAKNLTALGRNREDSETYIVVGSCKTSFSDTYETAGTITRPIERPWTIAPFSSYLNESILFDRPSGISRIQKEISSGMQRSWKLGLPPSDISIFGDIGYKKDVIIKDGEKTSIYYISVPIDKVLASPYLKSEISQRLNECFSHLNARVTDDLLRTSDFYHLFYKRRGDIGKTPNFMFSTKGDPENFSDNCYIYNVCSSSIRKKMPGFSKACIKFWCEHNIAHYQGIYLGVSLDQGRALNPNFAINSIEKIQVLLNLYTSCGFVIKNLTSDIRNIGYSDICLKLKYDPLKAIPFQKSTPNITIFMLNLLVTIINNNTQKYHNLPIIQFFESNWNNSFKFADYIREFVIQIIKNYNYGELFNYTILDTTKTHKNCSVNEYDRFTLKIDDPSAVNVCVKNSITDFVRNSYNLIDGSLQTRNTNTLNEIKQTVNRIFSLYENYS